MGRELATHEETLPTQLGGAAARQLMALLLGERSGADDVLRLTISFPDRDVNVRELAAYLEVIDRFYGRIVEGHLYGYGHKRARQLRITTIDVGSCKLTFAQTLGNSSPHPLIILYLLLRFLPYVRADAAEAVSAVGNGFRTHPSSTLVRENRQQLRLWMPADPLLSRLEHKYLTKLISLLDTLYAREAALLQPAIRFGVSYVQEIRLVVDERTSAAEQSSYPLRGTVLRYEQPTAPIGVEEWSALA
jgi:hypothetical protein